MDLRSILSPNDEKPQAPIPAAQADHNSKPSTPLHPAFSNPVAQPPTVPLIAPTSNSNSPQKKSRERADSPALPTSVPGPGPSPTVASSATISQPRSKHSSSLAQSPYSTVPSHVMSPLQHQNVSSPLISPVPFAPGTPHASIPRTQHSTPSGDNMTDLSSIQPLPPLSRPQPLHASSLDSIKSLDSVSRTSATQVSLTTNPRASFDINMMEVPKQSWKTDYSDADLPLDLCTTLSNLAAHLNETPSAYQSHISYINALHQSLVAFMFPASTDGSVLPSQDPATFPLLAELRFARSAMHKLFAPGETIWLDWLQDESILARSTENRIDVIELFRQAVSEEPLSCQLWAMYGDWVLECYRWANVSAKNDSKDPTEDELVGQEVFSWQMVQETWQQAVDSTRVDLASSHIVWNKYIEVHISEYVTTRSKETANNILKLFEARLQVPHIDSASTKSILAKWMSSNFSNDHYFEVMEDTNRLMKGALRTLESRIDAERQIEEAKSFSDKDAEYRAYMDYIFKETTPLKRKALNFEMCDALYRRCETRFPAHANIWEDHIAFVLEQGHPALDLLSLATKHCPWSGSLWSQYLLASERSGHSYEVTEGIKHRATSTGVLEAAGVEEVIKVHAAWCSYLRRRAFRADHDEDDSDIAEIGIRASIESIGNLGAKLGMSSVADPSFRLHRIYINFLSESNRWDNARREFDNAVRDYGTSWNFWIRFYHWEMKRWRRFATKDPDEEPLVTTTPPHLATAVLITALDQPSLDYPEPIIETLLHHCEDYESADEMQNVLLKIRKLEKALESRRQVEAAQNAQIAAATANTQSFKEDSTSKSPMTKRKREDIESGDMPHEDYKRSRTEDAIATVEQTPADDIKRDREHASILVQNLPQNISEGAIRQYFTNCGHVKALKMIDNGTSAIIEFEDDQAAHYALSKDGQQLEDSIIHVVLDTGSTVFLTNYAPDASESDIRELLAGYGEIISVRLPSLQGNKNRRFCYVQFKLPSQAQEAVDNLDGRHVDGFELTCKISNPATKKARQDTHDTDGRTIFVRQINFKATEDEVKNELARYGIIEKIRMPRHEKLKNRNKGIAFVTFSTLNEAKSALAFDGHTIKDREVRVEIAGKQEIRRHNSSTPFETNGKLRNDSAAHSEIVDETSRSERTIFLSNVPDTVNEARLRSIASKCGEVKKVILKTNHQGALIEFTTVTAAGEAELVLDGFEISPDRKLSVVSEEVMKSQKAEKKIEGFGQPKPKPMPSSGVISRPGQKKKIGQRSAMLHSSKANGSTVGSAKSNADFRALLNKGETKE